MDNMNPTPREWAEMSANALAEKNMLVVSEMMARFESFQARSEVSQREHWRRVFAASAINGGADCETAVAISEKMLNLLCIY